jgi:predicted ester cyclase
MNDAKQVVERAIKAWNGRDVQSFVALADPDIRISAAGGVELCGSDGMRQYYSLWRTACPDNTVTYHNIVGEADRAIGEGTFAGTHSGPLYHPAGDIPATGRHLSVDFVAAYRTAGDRVTSLRIYFDVLELMTKLGVAGAPAKA